LDELFDAEGVELELSQLCGVVADAEADAVLGLGAVADPASVRGAGDVNQRAGLNHGANPRVGVSRSQFLLINSRTLGRC
jgi:hypothetical protein